MRQFLSSLRLDAQLADPLYRQIYLRIKDAIAQGSLQAGSRLPSVRGLASDLGVARATVESAYGQLIAEGFLQSRGQAGTYVSSQLQNLPVRAALRRKCCRRWRRIHCIRVGQRSLFNWGCRRWMLSRAHYGRGLSVANCVLLLWRPWLIRQLKGCQSCARRS